MAGAVGWLAPCELQATVRLCPVCELETDERICPIDRISTLLVDLPDSPRPPAGGDVIGGRYELQEQLGSGGFARVYRARHLGTGAPLAVKVMMPDGLEDPTVAFKRFFQEAGVTSRLRHPNTVRVFDFGQEDSGIAYLAMEMLEGTTLKAAAKGVAARGDHWQEEAVISVMLAVARGLSEAHGLGLVHRDLSPNNIFIQKIEDAMMIRILDFGIAKVLESRKRLTAVNKVLGTPRYMSPEQIMDRILDGRSDLFSLAVVGYELLTGRVPHQAAPDPLHARVTRGVPDVREYRGDVSAGLADVLAIGLARYPEERFSTAGEMASSLKQLARRGPALDLLMPRPALLRQPEETEAHDTENEMSASLPEYTVTMAKAGMTPTRPMAVGPSSPTVGGWTLAALTLVILCLGGGIGVALASSLAEPAESAADTSQQSGGQPGESSIRHIGG